MTGAGGRGFLDKYNNRMLIGRLNVSRTSGLPKSPPPLWILKPPLLAEDLSLNRQVLSSFCLFRFQRRCREETNFENRFAGFNLQLWSWNHGQKNVPYKYGYTLYTNGKNENISSLLASEPSSKRWEDAGLGHGVKGQNLSRSPSSDQVTDVWTCWHSACDERICWLNWNPKERLFICQRQAFKIRTERRRRRKRATAKLKCSPGSRQSALEAKVYSIFVS